MSYLDGWHSLSNEQNTSSVEDDERKEGVLDETEDEVSLDLDDSELLELSEQWEKSWEKKVENELDDKRKNNKNAWLGKQDPSAKCTDTDNVIFESVETFIPNASRQTPVPVVFADNSEDGKSLANKVQKMLAFQADRLRLKTKNKLVLRHWAIDYIGAVKIGWDYVSNDVSAKVIRPQRLILDPDATNEISEYTGEYVGEVRRDSAATLIKRFPKKKEFIKRQCKDKMGTVLQYTEWWTPEYVFWRMEKEILAKYKNPNWNYDEEAMVMDEYGNQTLEKRKGQNHFDTPRMPYVFLTIFSLGENPVDDTSLIEQVIPLQKIVHKRVKQIDDNADAMNNGWLVSGDSFSKAEATGFARALNAGNVGWVPTGDVNKAARREAAVPLPQFVYQDLIDKRAEIKNVFGVRGSTPQGILNERTVGGKIEIKGQDIDRISQITEFLEQFNDEIFNWLTQMFVVYYDETHVAAIIGSENAEEFIELRAEDFQQKLLVSVKEGSMIPKDPLTRRNEAVDLWAAGAIDPITLHERLDDPNPREAAEKLITWQTNPQALLGEQGMQGMQGQVPGGSTIDQIVPETQAPPGLQTGTVIQ